MRRGFTLIELLVAIGIGAILMGIVVFTLQDARKSARDDRRKADLAAIQAGLENMYSDCGTYISTHTLNRLIEGGFDEGSGVVDNYGQPVAGGFRSAPCYLENHYIEVLPSDPSYPERQYFYDSEGPPSDHLPWRDYTEPCLRGMAWNPATGGPHLCTLNSCPSDPTVGCYERETYILCAALENPPSESMDPDLISACNEVHGCGQVDCNYVVTSPIHPQ